MTLTEQSRTYLSISEKIMSSHYLLTHAQIRSHYLHIWHYAAMKSPADSMTSSIQGRRPRHYVSSSGEIWAAWLWKVGLFCLDDLIYEPILLGLLHRHKHIHTDADAQHTHTQTQKDSRLCYVVSIFVYSIWSSVFLLGLLLDLYIATSIYILVLSVPRGS